jgi:MoxR-like ATPase
MKVTVHGVEITLAAADAHESEWVDYYDYARQLEAAWLRLSTVEPPLNPRLIGEPGLGKTTLASAVARRLQRELYIFQCTMDTRPEDLLITPVLTGDRRIEYRASSAVTAMIRGGILLLDEGNRMPERSWASLAPLMDERRYIESTLAAVKIHAHPDFRLCVTMNDDSSVYELPGYIQSRLKPKIEIARPPWEMQEQIVRLKCPGVDDDLLHGVFNELKRRTRTGCRDSIRDMLTLAQYAQKLRNCGLADPLDRAVHQVLVKADSSDDEEDES